MTADFIKQVIQEKVIGVWQPKHTAEGHFYQNTQTGIVVPSITTKQKIIKKDHLDRWMVRMAVEWLEVGDRFEKLKGPERNTYMTGAQIAHTEISGDAAGAGSLAHEVIENYLKFWIEKGYPPEDIRKGFLENADPRSIAGARAAEQLLRKNPIVPIATELLVGSEKINSAGTLDFLCLWGNRLTLVDWKLTNQVGDEYASQTAAYRYMFEEMTKLKIHDIKILQLSKECDRFTRYRVPNPRSAYNAMKALSKYYDWKHNGVEKVVKDVQLIDLRKKYGFNKTRKIGITTN